jgi:hypothetical protein
MSMGCDNEKIFFISIHATFFDFALFNKFIDQLGASPGTTHTSNGCQCSLYAQLDSSPLFTVAG